MENPDKEIINFLKENKVATVCCSESNIPFCFNCFYAIMEEDMFLVFKSDENTKHAKILAENFDVAGTVTAPFFTLGKLKGIQFGGRVRNEKSIMSKALWFYYGRFPYAMTVPGKIFIIELDIVKLTDNSKGFANKQLWNRAYAGVENI